jgi:hypothetical protein
MPVVFGCHCVWQLHVSSGCGLAQLLTICVHADRLSTRVVWVYAMPIHRTGDKLLLAVCLESVG